MRSSKRPEQVLHIAGIRREAGRCPGCGWLYSSLPGTWGYTPVKRVWQEDPDRCELWMKPRKRSR